MNSSNYADANHVTQSCNLTQLIYGGGPPSLPNSDIAIHPQYAILHTGYLLPLRI